MKKKITRKSLAELSILAGRFRQLQEDARNQKVNGVNCVMITEEGFKYFTEKITEVINAEL